MSKDLADRFDRDLSASDETIERFDELMSKAHEWNTTNITNPKERLNADLNNEFVAAEVESWEDLWDHYEA